MSTTAAPRALALHPRPWHAPIEVLAAVGEAPFAFGLLSDGSPGARWSYVGAGPSLTFHDLPSLRAALGATELGPPEAKPAAERPGFLGGAVGLAAFEWGAALEPSAPQTRAQPPWPDLAGGVYDAVLAFDHAARVAWAVGRGGTQAQADARAAAAAAWLALPTPSASAPPFGLAAGCAWDRDYRGAVAQVVEAIGAGEIFQANIARGWSGELPRGVGPTTLMAALERLSPAPLAGYLRLPGRAVVSRSPERFLEVAADGVAASSPIKGTRPRHADPREDARLAAELAADAKDRAENLMIVDVVRNDLARACRPGTVRVQAFCDLLSLRHVHHLVSTVTGRLSPGEDALSLFAAAFPPASVTGAPKLQALQVIARHEPPRGPYCGSLFRLGYDGGFDSNVLIRTLALAEAADGRWRWEARAGAGITYGSDPAAEDAEAAAKAAAVLAAFAE